MRPAGRTEDAGGSTKREKCKGLNEVALATLRGFVLHARRGHNGGCPFFGRVSGRVRCPSEPTTNKERRLRLAGSRRRGVRSRNGEEHIYEQTPPQSKGKPVALCENPLGVVVVRAHTDYVRE